MFSDGSVSELPVILAEEKKVQTVTPKKSY